MDNEEFDGFEVRVKLIENDMWQAYLLELPQISEVNSSRIIAVSRLYIQWQIYKKGCIEHEKNIPVPVSRQQFSGQFNIRVEAVLHRALVIEAMRSGMSLNALVAKKLKNSTEKVSQTFKIWAIERSAHRLTVTFYFENSYGERVGLTFTEANLGDELRNLGGDDMVREDNKLINCFSSSPLKERVQDFLSYQFPQPLTSLRILVIDCLLVLYDSINEAMHNAGLNISPQNRKDFLICKID